MSEHHPISDLMTETMSKIQEMVDVNTIIGNPIVAADGTTVIPVSKVSFGFGAGGSEFASKHAASGSPLAFGGGSGAGVRPCHRQGRQRQHPRHQRTGVRHGGPSGRDDPGCDQQGVQFRQRLQGQDRGRSGCCRTPVRRRIKLRFPAKPTRVNAE